MTRTASIPMTLGHWEAAQEVLTSGVLTEGPQTASLEERFAEWLGILPSKVVAVSSGTAALTTLLLAHGIREGDEVIVPYFCFTAAALAVRATGAEPVFADCRADWNIDPASVERLMGPNVKAVIGVDLHGLPADWGSLEEATNGRAYLIEDACAAVGAKVGSSPAGLLGKDGAAFSLNESKQLPAGEGGLVVADSLSTAAIIRKLRKFGESESPPGGEMDARRSETGRASNWKITELSAALANAGLSTLRDRVEAGRRNGSMVRAAADKAGLLVAPTYNGVEPSWFKIRVAAADEGKARAAKKFLAEGGVPIRDGEVAPLPYHLAFGSCRRDSFADPSAYSRSFCIGSRANPIFGVPFEVAQSWAEVIASLPSELVSPSSH